MERFETYPYSEIKDGKVLDKVSLTTYEVRYPLDKFFGLITNAQALVMEEHPSATDFEVSIVDEFDDQDSLKLHFLRDMTHDEEKRYEKQKEAKRKKVESEEKKERALLKKLLVKYPDVKK